MCSAIPADDGKIYCARLVGSERITPATSPEEVKNLVFNVEDSSFRCQVGQSVRVLAPGQGGNKYHARYYSIADFSENWGAGSQFTLCVRRCKSVDAATGAETLGVASSYLCNLKPGGTMEFSGPTGYPFPIPEDRRAGIVMLGMGTGIAPFLFLVKQVYEKFGGWEGKIRLFYGARTALELLYMNETNSELGKYYGEETFKAFRAVSPDTASGAEIALDRTIEAQGAELWEMLGRPDTHVYLAGMREVLVAVEKGLTAIAGSAEAWSDAKSRLVSGGRWVEMLY